MRSHQLQTNKPLTCPTCGKQLDGATGEKSMPVNGDISICIYCCELLQFEGKGMALQLVLMTAATKQDLKDNHPEIWKKLMMYLYTVKEI